MMHVMCNGGGTFFGRFFGCDKHHGMVDINHAIPWSCDTFYYTLAEKLGVDTIAKYATQVGLAQKTGIDLPDEATGTMPSTAWKLKTQHEKWYAGEVISVGIGQGAVQVTPLQLARALSGIASGGVLKRPHVVFPDKIPHDMESAMVSTYPGSGDRTIPLSPENWETITDAMAEALGPGGTAGAAHLEGIDFAGKTGTAQVVNHSAGATSLGAGRERANAWFVGMVPRRNPDIVVAVLWEHGGWGAGSAPVAAQVVNAFVDKQRKRAGNIRVADVPKAEPKPDQNSTPEPKPASVASTEHRETPRTEGVPTAAATPHTKPGAAGPASINRP
jgi:penicillin-binding protein 2